MATAGEQNHAKTAEVHIPNSYPRPRGRVTSPSPSPSAVRPYAARPKHLTTVLSGAHRGFVYLMMVRFGRPAPTAM